MLNPSFGWNSANSLQLIPLGRRSSRPILWTHMIINKFEFDIRSLLLVKYTGGTWAVQKPAR